MSETILVGYDAEPPAKLALQRALQEAKETHAKLVIAVVETMPLDPSGPQEFASLGGGQPLFDPVVEPPHLKPIIDDAAQQAEAAGVAVEFVWGAGNPARTIVDAARDQKAAKIMIGSHHHSLLGRVLGLDVAAEVKREAGCEVVVVE